MLLIGLLLILLAVIVGSAILIDATEAQTIEVFGISVSTTGAGVFVAGAVTMLALLVGVWMARLAMARSRRRRAEVKNLKRDRSESLTRLEEEKAALAAELERERAAREHGTADAYPQPVGESRRDATYADSPPEHRRDRTDADATVESDEHGSSRRGGLKGMFDRDRDGSIDRGDARGSSRADAVDLTSRDQEHRR
jgi:hypothetical protein